MDRNLQTIGFGGGCHWCSEAVFQSLKGIRRVRQGFIRSRPPDDRFSEAVEVTFDPVIISIRSLLEVHLCTHASTSQHSMRNRYRSAVYSSDEYQQSEAETLLAAIGEKSGLCFVTRVLPNKGFRLSDARYHNYRADNPDRPFCRVYIEPKLARIRTRFPELMAIDGDEAVTTIAVNMETGAHV